MSLDNSAPLPDKFNWKLITTAVNHVISLSKCATYLPHINIGTCSSVCHKWYRYKRNILSLLCCCMVYTVTYDVGGLSRIFTKWDLEINDFIAPWFVYITCLLWFVVAYTSLSKTLRRSSSLITYKFILLIRSMAELDVVICNDMGLVQLLFNPYMSRPKVSCSLFWLGCRLL